MRKTSLTRGGKELLKGELPNLDFLRLREHERSLRSPETMLSGLNFGSRQIFRKKKMQVHETAGFPTWQELVEGTKTISWGDILRNPRRAMAALMAGHGGGGMMIPRTPLLQRLTGTSADVFLETPGPGATPVERWNAGLIQRHEADEGRFAQHRRGILKTKGRPWIPSIMPLGPPTSALLGLPQGRHTDPGVLLQESRFLAAAPTTGARETGLRSMRPRWLLQRRGREARILGEAGVTYGRRNPVGQDYHRALRALRQKAQAPRFLGQFAITPEGEKLIARAKDIRQWPSLLSELGGYIRKIKKGSWNEPGTAKYACELVTALSFAEALRANIGDSA